MIDWDRVEELRSEIGEESLAEVAELFLEEADLAVRGLVDGLAANEVEAQLHFLKGSALNLGMTDLAQLCQEEERKAAAGHCALVDPPTLARVYQASCAVLLNWLATGSKTSVSAA